MSCIHYKFKSSLDYNSVTFDGLHLSLGDLKKAISLQKRLKMGEFELEIINAQTGDVYKKADELIAKNTSVIVSRVPITKSTASSTQRSWEAFKQECAKVKEKERQMVLEKQKQAQEASVAVPASEIDKIKAVIDQSTKGFEPSSFLGRHPSAVPSDSYICKRCGKKGHFISNCPNFKQEDRVIEPRVKRTTGIPSTMLTLVDDPLHPGALLTSHGQFAVPTVDVEGYKISKKDRPPFLPGENQPPEPEKRKIPTELLCHICEDLCVDAAIAPCCGTSFCDECLREELLESDDHQCPSCHERNVSPDRIVANRSMRIAVTNFLNDTGYTKVKRRRSNSASGDSVPKVPSMPTEPPAALPANPLLGNVSNVTPVTTLEPLSSVKSSVSMNQGAVTSYPSSGREADNNSIYSSSHIPSISRAPPPKPWKRYEPRYEKPYNPSMPSRDMKGLHWNPSMNIHPTFTTAPAVVAAAPAVAAAAAAAVATLVGQQRFGHPGMPPIAAMAPFGPGMAGYPERYMPPRPNMPPLSNMPHMSPPRRKPVDVFDSFADFTKKKSKTPEVLKSRSRSRSGSQRRRTHSYSPSKKGSDGRSPRRTPSRSRSRSRTHSFRRSRSGPRTPPHSPGGPHRTQKRSRSNSLPKRRSGSAGSRGLSELRSISPESPNKRSKSGSASPFSKSVNKKLSRSPRPLRSRSRSRSRSFKRSYRSRSWSRSKKGRSKSYSPLSPRRSPPRRSFDRSPRRTPLRSPRRSSRSPLRSPRRSPIRSPKRSLYSPPRSKRSLSPRRRSQSFSPRRRTPPRSKSRSPFGKRRPVYSRSRSPPRKRSLSPLKSRRSPSPYKGFRHRSPSPFQPRGAGGFKERGRDPYPRDHDRAMPRQHHSPPRRPGPTNLPPAGPQTHPNFPPVPYVPNMGLPAPEEFFKHDPAGYEKFLHNLYAQFGGQPPWSGQTGHPPAAMGNAYPPMQPHPAQPLYPQERRQWDSAPLSPGRRPRSPSLPGRRPPSPPPPPGERYRRDGGRSSFDKGRDRDRRPDDQRYEDRNRRVDYRDRDKKMDDRDKRVESKDRKFVSSEVRDRRGGGKENDRRRDGEKSKNYEKPRDSGKSKDNVSLERKKSPDRRKSPQPISKQHEKPKKVDEKKRERKKDEKEHTEVKGKTDVEENEVGVRKEEETANVKLVTAVTPNESKSNIPPVVEAAETKKDIVSDAAEENVPPPEVVKEKKAPGKKKIGAAGTKKLKAKDGSVPDGEKKEKKLKKKKLTFGASETDKGLKKKKVKRVVDYKSENNTSEDADLEKNNVSEASPMKKAKMESNMNGEELDQKLEASLNGETSIENQSLTNTSQPLDESLPGDGKREVSAEKGKSDFVTELPELSKWERDDFDIPDVERPEEKPKEKTSLPRSVVDKAEKFLVEKPMKNSVIAAAVTGAENNSEVSAKQRDSSEKHREIQDKSRNVSEKYSKDIPSRPKDRDIADKREDRDKRDDRHRGVVGRQRLSNDERIKEESDRHKEVSDRYKEVSDTHKEMLDRHKEVSDRYKEVSDTHKEVSDTHKEVSDRRKDYRSKSPLYSKDYRSGHNRDHRGRSPMQGKDYRSKSPISNKDHRSKSPIYNNNKDYRSKPASSNRPRKVFVDAKKDYRDRKGSDIQITVKGDRHKKSCNGGESTYHSSHQYRDVDDISDEDERSVVKSHSLERELKTSKNRKSKDDSKESRDKKQEKKEVSSKGKRKKSTDRPEVSGSKNTSGKDMDDAPHKSPRDLRHKIEEKTKSQNNPRKLSVMDESEFVPDYEDLAPETTASSPHGTSSPEPKETKKGVKRKSSEDEEDDDGDQEEEAAKPKKTKKKHKHKDKKEKKEKHKHKKKKHKLKSKEREAE